MNIFTRLSLGFIGAAVPVLVMAAPPNVSGITAVQENGGVRVSWAQAEGDISAYRIFYSHTSILGNGGLYDDFESADGSVNTHLLQSIPPVDELYVSILAVDSNGDESPYFLEEARVDMRTGTATSSVSEQQGNMLRLLSADAISATGVVLLFSHPVSIPESQATQAIMIDAGSGKMLQMRRYIIEGNMVTVHTVPQERSVAYRVTVGNMVTGLIDMQTIPLASDQTPVLFTGHASGAAPTPGTPMPPVSQTVPNVTQLRLRAQPDNNTYTVEATWQAPAQMISGYSVAQTTDGGLTYSQPMTIDKSATAIKVPGVPAGQFGMLVRVISTDGMLSSGVAQMIDLPAMQQPPAANPLPGTVTPMPSNGDTSLPSSGPALWLAIAGMGGTIGAWNLRRSRKQTA